MTERPRRVVVVGASIAGLSAAEALREHGFDGDITLLGAEGRAPYRRPAVSKELLDGRWEPDAAALVTPEGLAAIGVDLRVDEPALGIDAVARRIRTGRGDHAYDAVVLATGAAARRPAIAGATAVRTLRTLDDALRLREELRPGARVVVLGGSILASEIAATAAARGCRVTLVARGSALTVGAVGGRFSDRIRAAHARAGTRVRLRGEALAVTGGPARRTVVLADGERIPADVVVAATGAAPAIDWLRGSGLLRGGRLLADRHGRVSPRVHAVGDVAAWHDPVTGRAEASAHQLTALEQGQAVGRLLATGEPSAFPSAFFWSDLAGERVQAAGRFAGADWIATLDGDEHEPRAVVGWFRGGRLTGVVGWNAAREFRLRRAELDRDPGATDHREEPAHEPICIP